MTPGKWFSVGSASVLWLIPFSGDATEMPTIAEIPASVSDHEQQVSEISATPEGINNPIQLETEGAISTSAAALQRPEEVGASSLRLDVSQMPAVPSTLDAGIASPTPSQWHFSFEPFVVLPLSTTGTLGVGDVAIDVNAGLSELLSPLNLAFLGQFEGWYENQGFVVNTTYFAAGESATANFDLPPLSFPLALEGSASADLWRTDLLYAYRFTKPPESGYGAGFTEFDLPPVSFDLMGGLRFYSLSQEVSVNSNVGVSRSLSNSDFILEPVLRSRLRWNTSDYLAVLLDSSVSGLSLTGGSTFSVTATAGVEWLFSGNTSLSAGYQLNYIDYAASGRDGELDLLAHGPRLSFIFRF